MDAQPYTGGNDDGIKPVVMRYADILLMAAEIENELNGPSGAKQYLLPVRERAYKGHESQAEAYVAAISSKEEMFQAIVDERALEFCGEFLRKGDLIRWNLLKTNLDAAIDDMLALITFLTTEGEVPAGTEISTGYVNKYDDAKSTGFYEARIRGLYTSDPEQHMFWPIFNDTMTNSQGYIKNDYGYDSI